METKESKGAHQWGEIIFLKLIYVNLFVDR